MYNLSIYNQFDGLNSMEYEVVNATRTKLYTQLSVHIPGPKSGAGEARRYMVRKQHEFRQQSIGKNIISIGH